MDVDAQLVFVGVAVLKCIPEKLSDFPKIDEEGCAEIEKTL